MIQSIRLTLVATLIAFLIPCGAQSGSVPQMRGKSVRVTVIQSYADALGLELPVRADVTRLLSGSGVLILLNDAGGSDLALIVRIKGDAAGANYAPGGFRYTAVHLAGSVTVMDNNTTLYKRQFAGHIPPSLYAGPKSAQLPTDAPFMEAYNTFLFPQIADMVAYVFGYDTLISLLGDMELKNRVLVEEAIMRGGLDAIAPLQREVKKLSFIDPNRWAGQGGVTPEMVYRLEAAKILVKRIEATEYADRMISDMVKNPPSPGSADPSLWQYLPGKPYQGFSYRLSEIRDPRAVAVLLHLIEDKQAPLEVRRSGVIALGHIRDEKAIQALVANFEVFPEDAAMALEKITGWDLPWNQYLKSGAWSRELQSHQIRD